MICICVTQPHPVDASSNRFGAQVPFRLPPIRSHGLGDTAGGVNSVLRSSGGGGGILAARKRMSMGMGGESLQASLGKVLLCCMPALWGQHIGSSGW